MQLSAKASLEYTAQHLRDNFSNYSAWHARTALLLAAAQQARVPTLDELLAGESFSASPSRSIGPSAPAASEIKHLSGFPSGQERSLADAYRILI